MLKSLLSKSWFPSSDRGFWLLQFGQWDRYANDYNQYVVACLKAYADGWRITYDNVDEDLYNDIKRDWKKGGDKYSDEIKGFVGICCSFGSKWMDGLARDSEEQRNYTRLGFRYGNSNRKLYY